MLYKKTIYIIGLAVLFVAGGVQAATQTTSPTPEQTQAQTGAVALTPAQANRLQTLSYELLCPVCGGQTIAESNALAAEAMKRYVAQKIAQGETDAQIVAALKNSYGEDVSLRPDFSAYTGLLWLLPLLVLGLGVWALRGLFRPKN